MVISNKLRECAVLVRNGWCQHALKKSTPEGPQYCAIGVICKVTSLKGSASDITGRLWQPLHNKLKEALCYKDIVSWNNHPDTTAEDVAQGFERAAELAELEEEAASLEVM